MPILGSVNVCAKRTTLVLVILLSVTFSVIADRGKYIGSQRSDKYHYPWCKWAQRIQPWNEIWFSTVAEAREAGYVPCKVCKPPLRDYPSEMEIESEHRQEADETEMDQSNTQQVVGTDHKASQTEAKDQWGIPVWVYQMAILIFIAIIVIIVAIYQEKAERNRKREQQNIEGWLSRHFECLPKQAQEKLLDLRSEKRGKPRYPTNWKKISTEIRGKRPSCEVCGRRTSHIHHRKYRLFRTYKPDDLIALCCMCHYFVHPRGSMTRDAYRQHNQGK